MIPVNAFTLGAEEEQMLLECIKTNWISSEGPFVKEFEDAFAALHGRKFGIAVANGTAALDIALRTLALKPTDEVILPTFTIISPASAILHTGAKMVLVDVCPDTWNMAVENLEAALTPNTKAIVPVHIYGLPVNMQPLMDFADKHNLWVVEDAAEMIGQTAYSKPCGSFGDLSTFSFYPNKHITTGEGGMILTDNEELAKKCAYYRNLCFNPSGRRFVHEEIGWNYRMTNLQAALGLAQLGKLRQNVARKREIGALYHHLLHIDHAAQLPLKQTAYAQNIYWVFGIVLKEQAPYSAENLALKLLEKGIQTRPFFWCLHEQPVFRKMGLFEGQKFPNAENIARNGLYLPSGLGTTNAQIAYVAQTLNELLA
ncbi:MAG: DegT/DnrJ/EryC1/StrS family aminotransferase [Cytophagales bacterium]|nr:MAG: DegT/DnrJ/EryC1/StrS family aminotransferase [Cytophagales bacterium]TAF60509.1 MAG: DegT/DnrJ/EryC1/StrS family aminotransferase [Cytophagales bacterium]